MCLCHDTLYMTNEMQPSTCVVYRSKHFQNEVQYISKLLFCYILEINREFFGCLFFFFKQDGITVWKGVVCKFNSGCSLFICLKYLKLDFKEKKKNMQASWQS